MRRTLTAAVLTATLGVCGVANAQMTPSLNASPNNITIRGGIALPGERSLSDVSSTFTNVGFEYLFGESLLKGGETFLSVDAFFNNFNNVIAWPIMVNQRWYTGSNPQGHRNYFFLGLGMTWVDLTGSGSAIGARGGVGTELGPNIIAEISGYVSDRVNGARANAITFNIGYRF